METPLGTSFSTDENAVAQADVQLFGKTVKSSVVECNQEKFKKFLFSGSASPKAMRHYCKVSSETRSGISSEITPQVARTTAHSASGATSNEVLKTSRATCASCVNVPQGPAWLMRRHTIKVGEDQSCSPLRTLQFQVTEGSQQPLWLNQNAECR